jgi:hypothetical protein
MKTVRPNLTLTALLLLLSGLAFAQPANNTCAGATSLSLPSCNTYNLKLAASESSAGSCGGASTSTTYDVWFRFTAASTGQAQAYLSNLGTSLNINTTYIQIISGTCATPTTVTCAQGAVNFATTIGVTYFVRVYVTANPNLAGPASDYNFDLCVRAVTNDLCANPISLTSSTTCRPTGGNLALATASSPTVATSCGTAGGDMWYSFVAQTAYPIITVGNPGSNLSGNVRLQLLSGSCGAFTNIGCVSGNILNTATLSGIGAGLTVGTTYFIRIYSATSAPTGTNWQYNICVTDPLPGRVEYSKSYINITKGTTGGTVSPGDELEMRATFVITRNSTGATATADSLMFIDTLYNGAGLNLVPGSIALRTNEGTVYRSLTEAYDGDEGFTYASGSDQVIRINFGLNSSRFARGKLRHNSRPSVYSSTCIVMATYRVTVAAPYNTAINFKTGNLTFRDSVTGVFNSIRFAPNNLVVYESPGLCPNAVSATNAVGVESNGTFGLPAGPAPLARNRGTSPYTLGYLYGIFATGTGPQDYYYGITNNTSAAYTTISTWAKPSSGQRVFNLWDIIGDHTGASNPARGNQPCDTTQPVSATNPCGYMLVVNSAYKTDTVFQYTATNLCPNTYYEISAWFRNICYKCGCDSVGRGASTAGYIPSGPGDSSGVQPNLAFDVNGTDYYTTGNIRYTGVTPGGSDSTNAWVKRGFTYLTGPSETSFTLTIRNNAPGGGGNDWAMDDISIATCLPNMTYSPTLNPITCRNNSIVLIDTIRSYFNNYTHYKWQRSTDNGATWTDLAGTTGSGTPSWNGSAYEYITHYIIPPSATTIANNGDRYRVVVATTSSNLSNGNCQVTDGVSIIRLTVLDCEGTLLNTQLLSFNGRQVARRAALNWTTSREQEPLTFEVQRSTDGNTFQTIATVASHGDYSATTNNYSFTDSLVVSGKTRYRIQMRNASGRYVQSRIIQLDNAFDAFSLGNVVNPFSHELTFEATVNKDSRLDISLVNAAGSIVKKQSTAVSSGVNSITVTGLENLPSGVYMLQVANRDQQITRKLIKR